MSSIQEPIATLEANVSTSRTRTAKRKWEAADTVIALAGGLILIIFGIFAFLCWQGYATTIQNAKTRAQTSADIVATQTAWLVGSGLASLRLIEAKLAFEPAVLDPVEKADLDDALKALPTGASLALYDPSGAVLPNGGSPSLPANIADTSYFAEVTSGGLAETIAPQDADASTGAPLIVMARRLGGDTLAGVAVLAIPGSALDAFFAAQSMLPDSTISIIREDGFVVARYPALPQTLNVAETSPFWQDLMANDRGTYDSGRSPADGISRIVGYTHVREARVIAVGSVSKESVLAGLWTAIITVLWLMGPIAIALFGGSLLTARLLRRSAQTQRTLAAAVAHNEVLFREIHHRVKNNLQSVASLLQMQPIPREIKANMGQRIAAMSAVHEHIYRSNDFETVRVRDYLQTLIASMRAGHDPRIEVVEQLDDLSVDRDNATPLGLVVNEVVSNAFKHAFPDGTDGRIVVALTRVDNGRGRLTIEDNGVGYDPATPAKGIGQRLIKALTLQLTGESKIESAPGGGSRFVLEFPLAHGTMG
jgi:two-component sensor histidine kinase